MIASLAPLAAQAQVGGRVVDAETGAPIGGALVQVQASDVETRAAADGTFTLEGASGASIVIAAAQRGYFNGSVVTSEGAVDLSIALDRVPDVDDRSYPFASPTSCSHCHLTQFDEWAESAMAHAGTNTWVADLYAGNGTPGGATGWYYTRDSAHAGASSESECASCHQPVVWAKSPFRALEPPDSENFDVREGVSCDLCHKIASVDETRMNFPGIHPAAVTFTRPDLRGWTVMYGVLGDVDFEQAGDMRASYNPQLTAAVCGLCHQDRNDPDGDGDFEDEDGDVSEPTFFEWRNSPYGDPASGRYASCVDCHMAPNRAPEACDVLDTPLSRPEGDVRSHRFEGTTPAMLENAATLRMDAQLSGDRIDVVVEVENDRTGHHVPTGVTIRNVVLVIDAFRMQDGMRLEHLGTEAVHPLGGEGDPAQGYYGGLPGKLFAKINHGPDGEGPVFYTEATGTMSDTRIAPLATDRTEYAFAVPGDGGELQIRARLIYRRSFRAIVDTKGWTTDGHGRPLEDIAPPHFGHLMAERTAAFSLPYTGPVDAGPDVDSGVDGGAGDAAIDAGATPPGDGGCGCTAPGARGPARGAWIASIGMLALVVVAARRRAVR